MSGAASFTWRSATATKLSPSNGTRAGEHLPEHDAERVDVGRRRDGAAARLLRREVLAGPDDRSRLRHAVLDVERARDAEVGDLDAAVLAEEDVLRLDVAMDETALVRERQAVRDSDRKLERAPQRQRAGADDQLLEVLAVDELEDDVLAAPRPRRGR